MESLGGAEAAAVVASGRDSASLPFNISWRHRSDVCAHSQCLRSPSIPPWGVPALPVCENAPARLSAVLLHLARVRSLDSEPSSLCACGPDPGRPLSFMRCHLLCPRGPVAPSDTV